ELSSLAFSCWVDFLPRLLTRLMVSLKIRQVRALLARGFPPDPISRRSSRRLPAAPTDPFAFPARQEGNVEIRIEHPGFTTVTRTVDISKTSATGLTVTLSTGKVIESVDVTGASVLLQPNASSQTATISRQQLESLPTASHNYTHLMVGEAGVAAPLPDRTGKGMNLATSPGSQNDDGTQSLNPSVNGARPTNNSLMINGVDATNMMNGGGSLGNNINIPLDALEAVEIQTALYSATTGRNGGANIQMITRSGTNEFHGSLSHFFQNEILNANEFFLKPIGNGSSTASAQRELRWDRWSDMEEQDFFYAAVSRTDFLSLRQPGDCHYGQPRRIGRCSDERKHFATGQPVACFGCSGQPAVCRQGLSTAIRRFPADQIPGLENKFFTNTANPAAPVFRALTPADIHPVAINILNVKRNGNLLLPSETPANRLLPGNATYGREREQVNAFPTFFNSWSGSASIEHNFTSNDRLRLNYIKSQQFVEETFPWANSSVFTDAGINAGLRCFSVASAHVRTHGWMSFAAAVSNSTIRASRQIVTISTRLWAFSIRSNRRLAGWRH
ncbi:MAG: Plug domain-containing protein, partial [Bryobacteraceae bacterium]